MSERVTVTIAGPSYRNEYDAPPTTDGRSVEWRAFVRQLRTAIDHARQLEALEARRQPGARCGYEETSRSDGRACVRHCVRPAGHDNPANEPDRRPHAFDNWHLPAGE